MANIIKSAIKLGRRVGRFISKKKKEEEQLKVVSAQQLGRGHSPPIIPQQSLERPTKEAMPLTPKPKSTVSIPLPKKPLPKKPLPKKPSSISSGMIKPLPKSKSHPDSVQGRAQQTRLPLVTSKGFKALPKGGVGPLVKALPKGGVRPLGYPQKRSLVQPGQPRVPLGVVEGMSHVTEVQPLTVQQARTQYDRRKYNADNLLKQTVKFEAQRALGLKDKSLGSDAGGIEITKPEFQLNVQARKELSQAQFIDPRVPSRKKIPEFGNFLLGGLYRNKKLPTQQPRMEFVRDRITSGDLIRNRDGILRKNESRPFSGIMMKKGNVTHNPDYFTTLSNKKLSDRMNTKVKI